MRRIFCWVIFVYRCKDKTVEVLLFSKDKKIFIPLYWEGKTFENARDYLHKFLDLESKDFYTSRDINWSISLSVGGKDKVVYKISTSVARVRDNTILKIPNGFNYMKWFNKKQAYELLKHWKGYTRSFKKIFTDDNFWECVKTE